MQPKYTSSSEHTRIIIPSSKVIGPFDITIPSVPPPTKGSPCPEWKPVGVQRALMIRHFLVLLQKTVLSLHLMVKSFVRRKHKPYSRGLCQHHFYALTLLLKGLSGLLCVTEKYSFRGIEMSYSRVYPLGITEKKEVIVHLLAILFLLFLLT